MQIVKRAPWIGPTGRHDVAGHSPEWTKRRGNIVTVPPVASNPPEQMGTPSALKALRDPAHLLPSDGDNRSLWLTFSVPGPDAVGFQPTRRSLGLSSTSVAGTTRVSRHAPCPSTGHPWTCAWSLTSVEPGHPHPAHRATRVTPILALYPFDWRPARVPVTTATIIGGGHVHVLGNANLIRTSSRML